MTKQTTNKKLHSKSVLRQIRLLRVSEEITQEILAFLEKVDSDLAEQLAQRLVNIKTRGVLPKTYTNKRLLQLYKYVHKAIQSQSKDMYTILSTKLIDIANNEIGFQVKDITEALPIAVDVVTPPKAMLSAVVTTNPLQGKVLKDWVAGWAEGKEVRVLEEIRKGIVEGQTAETIVTRIRGTQRANFADGILSISGRGAKSLVRTTVNGVSTAARELLYTNNKDIVKGVQWVSTLDSRTSPICRSRDGKVYPVDSGPRPPAHFSCFPGDTFITPIGEVSTAYKRVYKGDVIIIRTASGLCITCTPNHPILTQRGWIAAKLLNKSDQVVKVTGEFFSNYLIDNMESRIEDIFNTVSRFSLTKKTAKTLPNDFHGDGINKYVTTIATNRILSDSRNSSLNKIVVNKIFSISRSLSSKFSDFFTATAGRKFIFRPFSPAHSIVGGLCKSNAFFLASSGHSSKLLFRSISRLNSGITQSCINRTGGTIKKFGYTDNTYSGIKQFYDFLRRNVYSSFRRTWSYFSAIFAKKSKDNTITSIELARQILDGCPRFIEFDNITGIVEKDFFGHVYNLETASGCYIANGIIAHNCRSTTAPVLKSWKELGIDLEEIPVGTRPAVVNGVAGDVPETMTYAEWLKEQREDIQKEVLGKKRFEMFKNGATLDSFVDEKTGKQKKL